MCPRMGVRFCVLGRVCQTDCCTVTVSDLVRLDLHVFVKAVPENEGERTHNTHKEYIHVYPQHVSILQTSEVWGIDSTLAWKTQPARLYFLSFTGAKVTYPEVTSY